MHTSPYSSYCAQAADLDKLGETHGALQFSTPRPPSPCHTALPEHVRRIAPQPTREHPPKALSMWSYAPTNPTTRPHPYPGPPESGDAADRHPHQLRPPSQTRHSQQRRRMPRRTPPLWRTPQKKDDQTNPKNRPGATVSGVRAAKTNPNEPTSAPNRTQRTHRPTGPHQSETSARGISEDRARRAWRENRGIPRCPQFEYRDAYRHSGRTQIGKNRDATQPT